MGIEFLGMYYANMIPAKCIQLRVLHAPDWKHVHVLDMFKRRKLEICRYFERI